MLIQTTENSSSEGLKTNALVGEEISGMDTVQCTHPNLGIGRHSQ